MKQSKMGNQVRQAVNMPVEIYNKLKERAFQRNVSMSKYTLEALVWRLETQEVDDERDTVHKL